MVLPRFRKKLAPDTYGNDVGFGTSITESKDRFVNKDGSLNIIRKGGTVFNLYHELVEMSWTRFFLIVFLYYVVVNFLFALGFVWLGVDHIGGITPGGFLHNLIYAYFFSTQTFTTVGYGVMHPTGIGTNLLASINSMIGVMTFALASGLFFSRFSKPRSLIRFSRVAVITPPNPLRQFQFRIINQRPNKMTDLVAQVILTWLEADGPNQKTRRFAPLKLERHKITMMPLNWNLVHTIDEESPLFGRTEEEILDMSPEFLVLIQGFDETYNQTVHAGSSYTTQELVFNKRFAGMYEAKPDQGTFLYTEKLDEVV